MHHTLCPLEGYRMLITPIGESVNGSANLVGTRGTQAAQDGSGQNVEPHLHLVQPGGMGRRVMEVDQGVVGQPPVMLGPMSAQVVENHMQLRFGMLRYYLISEYKPPVGLIDAEANSLALADAVGVPVLSAFHR